MRTTQAWCSCGWSRNPILPEPAVGRIPKPDAGGVVPKALPQAGACRLAREDVANAAAAAKHAAKRQAAGLFVLPEDHTQPGELAARSSCCQ